MGLSSVQRAALTAVLGSHLGPPLLLRCSILCQFFGTHPGESPLRRVVCVSLVVRALGLGDTPLAGRPDRAYRRGSAASPCLRFKPHRGKCRWRLLTVGGLPGFGFLVLLLRFMATVKQSLRSLLGLAKTCWIGSTRSTSGKCRR